MKDMSVFDTEFGVASLVLKEVPYRQEAYIIIRSALQPEELLRECISFCRMVGAEKIYARGHEVTEQYPLHCAIVEMSGSLEPDPEKTANLWPVTEENIGKWRQLMNEKLRSVDNAATLEKRDEKDILEKSGAYFVHSCGQLLGAGWLEGDELHLLASAERGAGERVFHTLLSVTWPERVKLQVASTNEKAIRLYERLGLVKTGEAARWYRVF